MNTELENDLDSVQRLKRTINRIKQPRSCFTCRHSTVCQGKRELHAILQWLPVNIDGSDAPSKSVDMFKHLASCCLMYNENK